MEIKLHAEFTMSTFAGYFTYCNASEYIWSDFRDISNVEKAVKYVKTLFAKKGIRDLMLTFTVDNGTTYGISTARIFHDFKDGQEKIAVVRWDNNGNRTSYENVDKLSAKLIKSLYLECADRTIELSNSVLA